MTPTTNQLDPTGGEQLVCPHCGVCPMMVVIHDDWKRCGKCWEKIAPERLDDLEPEPLPESGGQY